jgi:hypothetical protein
MHFGTYCLSTVRAHSLSIVMPGLVPGIHALRGASKKTWMAGTSPAMTNENQRPAMTIESECRGKKKG